MTKCRDCGEVFPTPYDSQKHRKTNHPKEVISGSAMEALLAGRQQISTAINQMEHEREELHKKVLLYDDNIAKYRKLL